MKLKITILIAFASLLCSCGAYEKLLKSDDAMAKYQMGMELYAQKKYTRASALFDSALPTLIGTAHEDTVMFMLGKTFYASKDYNMAGEMMNQYRNRFPRSGNTPEAEYIYAMSFYMISPDVEKDQQNTRRAIMAFGEYMNRHPQSPFNKEIQVLTEELNGKLYYKKYLNAALYYKLGHYLSAVTSLRAILKENPETPYREDIMFMICKSWYEYAKNSVYARQLDRYLKMIDAYYNFKTAFPESKQFDRELLRMKDLSQEYVDKNGVTAQSIESSATKIRDARATIDECKDKIFYAKTRKEKDDLRQKISTAREVIKAERKNVAAERQVMKDAQKAADQRQTAAEKVDKAEKAAAQKTKQQQRKEKIKQKK